MNRMLKNILSGIGTVLVLSPATGYSHYRGHGIDFGQSDVDALKSDVRAIGGDFHKACELGRKRAESQKSK